jgi:hypothetical protein
MRNNPNRFDIRVRSRSRHTIFGCCVPILLSRSRTSDTHLIVFSGAYSGTAHRTIISSVLANTIRATPLKIWSNRRVRSHAFLSTPVFGFEAISLEKLAQRREAGMNAGWFMNHRLWYSHTYLNRAMCFGMCWTVQKHGNVAFLFCTRIRRYDDCIVSEV